jgi:hypothetical protein
MRTGRGAQSRSVERRLPRQSPAKDGTAPREQHAAGAVGALALELAPVCVNTVTPGFIETPLLHTAYRAERDTAVQSRAADLPGRGVSIADEVTQLIMMLMTNDYMAGEVAALVKISWLIVTFGDSGSLRHNGDKRVEGDTPENPY